MRRARQSLDERESVHARELAAIVDQLPVAVFGKDARDFRMSIWNKEAERLFGISRQEILGKTDFELFPLEQAEFFRATDEGVIRSGRSVEVSEERALTRSDGSVWLRTRKVPLYDDLGYARTLLGVCENITERKKTVDRLREIERQLKGLSEAIPGSLLQLIQSSGGAFHIGGTSRSMVADFEFADAASSPCPADEWIQANVPRDDQADFRARLEDCARTQQAWRWTGRIVTTSGQVKRVRGFASPRSDASETRIWDGLLVELASLESNLENVEEGADELALLQAIQLVALKKAA